MPDVIGRLTYISWAPHCSRSDHTARELGGRSHMVYVASLGSHPSTIAFKYAAQAWRTWRILRRERPDIVFVMTPPVFAALPAFCYAWWHRAIVVLDAHTCAFVLRRWRPFLWLQRALCRRAATTLVTNAHIGDLVRSGGGHATLVPDVPVIFEGAPAPPPDRAFHVVVVASFDVDEPVAAIFEAAALVPEVQFFVTGDAARLDPRVSATAPANLTLTGFLDTSDYGRLLLAAGVVVDLTTQDHTMLRGAYEAIYQGVPVIVSDWSILREAFPLGAIHVDNTPGAIAAAVRRMRDEIARYRAGAARLRTLKLQRWENSRQAILDRLTRAG
jgi:glycosyltransferase involved in cell wall biosynthesis